jgi:hypothetical protein
MVFLSKIRELRLVMKPKWVSKDPVMGVTVHEGRHIQFTEGRYETNDPEEIEFIKNSSAFGSKVTSIEAGDIAGAKGVDVVTGSMGAGPSEEKRRFKCIRCGMDGFESGFEVAQHRKSGECDMIRGSSGTAEDSEPAEEKDSDEEKINE